METDGAPEPGPEPREGAEATQRPPRKLSEELRDLQQRFAERSVTLQEVITVLRGRAYLLLVILLALPFCTPLPLPGLSTPFGLVIGLISLRLALGQHPWLPASLLHRELPAGFFSRTLAVTARVIRFLETFLRPRATALVVTPGVRNLHAVVMVVAAGVLLLPLPIPFSNAAPAWVILLIAAGLLERDGIFIVAGYAALAAGIAFFIMLGGATHHIIDAVRQWLGR